MKISRISLIFQIFSWGFNFADGQLQIFRWDLISRFFLNPRNPRNLIPAKFNPLKVYLMMAYNLRTGLKGGQVVIKRPVNIYKLREWGSVGKSQIVNITTEKRNKRYLLKSISINLLYQLILWGEHVRCVYTFFCFLLIWMSCRIWFSRGSSASSILGLYHVTILVPQECRSKLLFPRLSMWQKLINCKVERIHTIRNRTFHVHLMYPIFIWSVYLCEV